MLLPNFDDEYVGICKYVANNRYLIIKSHTVWVAIKLYLELKKRRRIKNKF